MLSNFGLSSKSHQKNYEDKDIYSDKPDDSKRIQKSKTALSRYIIDSKRNVDFDDIPSQELQMEL